MTKSENLGPSTFSALRRTYLYAESLRFAARACITNFRWLSVHRSRHIPLLDFDVICGAYPAILLQKRLTAEPTEPQHPALLSYGGPTTIRYYLALLRNFVIPAGAAAELLSRKERMAESISARAETFLRQIQNFSSKETVGVTSQQSRSLLNLLKEDLSHFADDLRDHKLLDTVIARATPMSDLLLPTSPADRSDVEVFRSSLAFLKARRPGVPANNFHDALNAAVVVRLFNAARSPHSERRVPVLISQTRAVHDLDALSKGYLRVEPAEELPFVFTGAAFLILSESFLRATEGRHSAAVDEASALEDGAAALSDASLDLLHACQGLIAAGVPDAEIAIRDLPAPDWDRLLHRRELFTRHWGSMLGPVAMAEQRDKRALRGFLRSEELLAKLRSEAPEDPRRLLSLLERELESVYPADYDLWRVAVATPTQGTTGKVLESAFALHVVPDDGSLLRDTIPGLPVTQIDASRLSQDHDIRIAALPAYLSAGATLVVSSHYRHSATGGRVITCTWLHALEPTEIVNQCLVLFTKFVPSGTRIEVQVFTPLAEHRAGILLDEADDAVTTALRSLEDAECLQFACSFARLYVDLQPLEGRELQVGLVMREQDCNSRLLEELTAAISATSEIPLSGPHVRGCLRDIFAALRLQAASGETSDPPKKLY